MRRSRASIDEGKLIGSLIKKKKAGRSTHVYFNKNSNGTTKYFTGIFISEKNGGKSYTYRSSYELRCYELLEEDTLVVSYEAESFTLEYIDMAGKTRLYIPDLLVLFKDGSLQVWEVKPEVMLLNGDVQRKAAACRQFMHHNFKDVVHSYKFITEKHLFQSASDYIKFIALQKAKKWDDK